MNDYGYIDVKAKYSENEKMLLSQQQSIKENMDIIQKEYKEVQKKLKKKSTPKLIQQAKELEKAYGFHLTRYNKITNELFKNV